ncbi:hypothetical protein GM658_12585 [Pseudoduganella eburnea]|uniref:Bacteriophage tail tape measure N-terminal domain-containing protein n=1 Tax=Massilia eburnea TaxID=1776165 RepID=A0A6L6QH84_9BURK|nr:hypothetical protein [Massilia eburnea]MTW11434.1 hypothetical protein [Massilia eburnea]
MSALGSLVVKLALEYAEYTKGLDKSDQAALQFAERTQKHFDTASQAGNEFMGGLVKGAIGAVAALASVGAAMESLNHAVDRLATLDDLTQKTGASVENLSRMQQVASAFGHDFGGVDAALSKLAKGMAGVDDDSNKVNKALHALGISAKDSAGKMRDPSEVFIEASKKLATYGDSATKTRLVNDLLGKSGADLLPYMNDVSESLDKFQGFSAEAAANAAKFQDQFGMMRAKFEAFVTQIATGMLPAMNDLVEVFTESASKADGLSTTKVADWADDAAVGFARLVDVALLIPRILSAISGSFKVVWADMKLITEIGDNLSPLNVARKVAAGGDPLGDVRKAWAEHQSQLEAANQKYDDLWNKPANEYEQAMLKKLADRKAAEAGGAQDEKKGELKYQAGGGSGDDKSDYDHLNKSLQQRIALAEREIAVGKALKESEKELAALMRGRAEGTVKLTDAEFDKLKAGIATLDVDQRIIAGRQNIEALNKKLQDDSRKAVDDAIHEAERNEKLAETIGLTTAEIEAAGLARAEEQLAQRATLGLTKDEIDALERLIAAKRRSSAAASRVDEVKDAKKGLDDVNAFLDPAKAKSFGEALRNAFGAAGGEIAKLTGAMDDYGQRQAAIAKQRGNAAKAYLNGLMTEKEYQKDIAALNAAETKSRLAGYGDMAGAAAGFFGEQSKGYQVLMAVSKVFHAAELAMTMAELVPKGIAAVLNQGTGDPYTAFGRMAAMAAIVAGLGVAIGGVGGGGGGQVSAKDRQAAQGTGSVLGDSKAKSDSIAKSLDIVASNSGIELSHTSGMLDALRGIESNIAGLVNVLARNGSLSGDVTPGSKAGADSFGNSTMGVLNTGGPFGLLLDKVTGGAVGNITGKILGSIFGGKVSTLDTGLTADSASLGSVLAGGLKARQYTETKKSGGWFHSDKYSTTTAALGKEANDQFTKVITGMAGSIQEAGKLLGIDGDAFTNHLKSFVVEVGKISIKDLKPEEIQKQLEAVFSKLGDDMARFSVGGLEQFQEVGEGYLQTLARVASNYANLDSVLASIGATFGSVGMESLVARERFLQLTGGVKDLNDKTKSFAEKFLTEAERLAPVQKWVDQQMAALGLANVTTMEQYKQTVLNLANSGALATEAGAKQYAGLLDLADAFAKTHEQTKVLVRDEKDIANERADLQSQLDDLTLNSTQLLARQRDALDASNRSLFDQVQAAKAVRDAQEQAKSSLGSFISKMESFAATTAGLNNSLALGGLSNLTPEQQYAEARRQFERTRQLAAVGDANAQGQLGAVEQAFLQLSQKINGSDAQYSSDLAAVMRTNDEFSQWANESVDVAKASLDALSDSAASLADISAMLKEIALTGATQSVLNARAEVQTSAQASSAINYSAMGTSNMIPLVDEIKALRASNEAMAAELKGLRSDQQKQTGDLITAGAGAAQHAAETVVEGVRQAVTDSAYAQANSVRTIS